MSKVTLDDLSLRDISLVNLKRLEELRGLHFASQPEICVELPRLMTRYMKMGRVEHHILQISLTVLNKPPVVVNMTGCPSAMCRLV